MSLDVGSQSQFDLLSDYSFLERSVHEVYIWIWFIIHVWRCDQFAALKWHRIRSLELRSYVTIFILLALPLGSFYDIVSVITCFLDFGVKAIVRSKPESMWSDDNKMWITPNYYTEMVGFSLQIGTLFLLQCFWNYLSNSIAKISFMSSFEFKLYIVCSSISICIYPVLQVIFRNSPLLREVIPQLLFASQLFIISMLGIRTHFKFNKLIKDASGNRNIAHIIAKIRYFLDMNKVLTLTLFVMCASFFVLAIDLTSTTRPINGSKIASDILIAHINIASIIEWLVLILIFYPRKGFVGTTSVSNIINTGSINGESFALSQTKASNMPGTGAGIPTSPADPYTDRFVEKSAANTDNYAMHSTSATSKTSANITVPPVASTSISESPMSLLKRNISISKDGKMVYSETKPLGKVHGSEFVAVEKADPSVMSYFMDKDGIANSIPPLPQSLDVTRSQSPLSQQISASSLNDTNATTSVTVMEPEPRKSSQQERMMVLQRQQEDYNALRMATAKLQQRDPSAELERSGGFASSTALEELTQPQINSDITNYNAPLREEEDDETSEEFFYAM
ncbi:260_t:CDS:2 [Acaulospora morrowiae]|uniref:260_t:CDS:1 n=1 Tax=Acaulospora morrowiae TaxID=94023 RepID=A0A9N9FP54_9GLOM|nr:260_t:CDS:2 [Acaulospora morrowiae]